MMRYLRQLLALATIWPTVLAAQTSEAGVLFLLIPPGARHNGMGQSGVSNSIDANAIYYNPGALGFIITPERPRDFQFMHVEWLPAFNLNDLFYDYGSFAMYLEDIGVVGVNFTFFNMGEQIVTDNSGAETGQTIRSFDMALSASYATKLNETMGIGGNLKFIYSRLSNVSATAENEKGIGSSVAIDVGFMKKDLFVKDLTFGASISNIGPKIAYVDEAQADPLPTNLRLGVTYPIYQNETHRATATYEINRLIVKGGKKGSDNLGTALFSTWTDNGWHRLGHNFGAEYTYADFVSLRSGTALDVAGDLYDLTFGAGIRYSIVRIDFAYTTKLKGRFNPRDGSQFYSIGLNF